MMQRYRQAFGFGGPAAVVKVFWRTTGFRCYSDVHHQARRLYRFMTPWIKRKTIAEAAASFLIDSMNDVIVSARNCGIKFDNPEPENDA